MSCNLFSTRVVLLKYKFRSCHSSQLPSPRASHLIPATVPTVALVGLTTSAAPLSQPPPKPLFSSPCSLSSHHTDLNVVSGTYQTYLCLRAFAFATPWTRWPQGTSLVHFSLCSDITLSMNPLLILLCKIASHHLQFPCPSLLYYFIFPSHSALTCIACLSHWNVSSRRAKNLVCCTLTCILRI